MQVIAVRPDPAPVSDSSPAGRGWAGRVAAPGGLGSPRCPCASRRREARPRTLPRVQQRDAQSHHANYANRTDYSCYSECPQRSPAQRQRHSLLSAGAGVRGARGLCQEHPPSPAHAPLPTRSPRAGCAGRFGAEVSPWKPPPVPAWPGTRPALPQPRRPCRCPRPSPLGATTPSVSPGPSPALGSRSALFSHPLPVSFVTPAPPCSCSPQEPPGRAGAPPRRIHRHRGAGEGAGGCRAHTRGSLCPPQARRRELRTRFASSILPAQTGSSFDLGSRSSTDSCQQGSAHCILGRCGSGSRGVRGSIPASLALLSLFIHCH